ncbi:Hypothetical protein CINCED_3A025913 [Cinara cedri]|uniref:Uncharacterized protein n=1 Tax=Cinara cedri TaxID=506608 RepID=A0A5E4MIH7_9HEMI|nr:Hypothetical protein CINCED_3A025913 [Cinara cedri]
MGCMGKKSRKNYPLIPDGGKERKRDCVQHVTSGDVKDRFSFRGAKISRIIVARFCDFNQDRASRGKQEMEVEPAVTCLTQENAERGRMK